MKCGAGKNQSCIARHGDQCMEHLITDTPNCKSRVPITNADRIRAMSDEELAEIIAIDFTDDKIGYCQNKVECEDLLDNGGIIPADWCMQCALEWLTASEGGTPANQDFIRINPNRTRIL